MKKRKKKKTEQPKLNWRVLANSVMFADKLKNFNEIATESFFAQFENETVVSFNRLLIQLSASEWN